ncbi:MAG TPA: ABC transporter ATP-binding protein [Candidatus Obscuribacterales bacterium]
MMLDTATQIALTTRKLTLAYDGNAIIRGLDLAIPQGQITTLVGPNGCGKSTLLRGMARLLKPQGGTVYLEGDAIAHLPTKALAQRLGILPQSPAAPEGLTVRELVAQGRYPHQNWLQQWSPEDELKVEAAIATTHLQDFANRPLDTLSGGQRQRAWIAMALAQDTATLLLDEPTTYLDLAHQIEVLDLLYGLNKQAQRTIVMVLHDLNMACRYSHHLIALRDGQVMGQGRPAEVVTEAMVQQVFGLNSRIITDPVAHTPLCIPIGQAIAVNSPEK